MTRETLPEGQVPVWIRTNVPYVDVMEHIYNQFLIDDVAKKSLTIIRQSDDIYEGLDAWCKEKNWVVGTPQQVIGSENLTIIVLDVKFDLFLECITRGKKRLIFVTAVG